MNAFDTNYNKAHADTILRRFVKWYRINGYKVNRIILFPIWIIVCIKDKIDQRNYDRHQARNAYTDERAKAFLDKYLPKICDKTETGYYLYNNGMGFIQKCIKGNDRKFGRSHQYEIVNYLVDTYEVEGYTKNANRLYNHCEFEIELTANEGNE